MKRLETAERQAEIRARGAAFNAWYVRARHETASAVSAYNADWEVLS